MSSIKKLNVETEPGLDIFVSFIVRPRGLDISLDQPSDDGGRERFDINDICTESAIELRDFLNYAYPVT